MNTDDMLTLTLPGSYPYRKYIVWMVWNIIYWRWEEVLPMRDNKQRTNIEDRVTQPMEGGGWVSQLKFRINETVRWKSEPIHVCRGKMLAHLNCWRWGGWWASMLRLIVLFVCWVEFRLNWRKVTQSLTQILWVCIEWIFEENWGKLTYMRYGR